MSLAEFLQLSAEYGADVVQLCENSGVEHLDEGGLKDLAYRAQQLGLTLECGGSGGGNRDPLMAGIRRTASLGGNIYRCVLDSDGATPEAVIAILRELLPLLRDCEVTLCAENHFRFSPQTLRRIVRAVDDPAVGVCLDPLNSIAQWIGPEETIRELIPLTRTAHVKDAHISRTGTGWKITGTPLGEGHLDLAGYLATVTPRVESILLESWMDSIDEEDGAATLEQEALWARNGLVLIRELTNLKCSLATVSSNQ